MSLQDFLIHWVTFISTDIKSLTGLSHRDNILVEKMLQLAQKSRRDAMEFRRTIIMMKADSQIPEPFLFNLIKHHLGFIREFVNLKIETAAMIYKILLEN